MNVQIQVDTSGLAAGIAAAKKYSKRTMPELVNTSAYWIAVNAKNEMPFVTQEKINTDLGTIVSLKVGKRGKFLSPKYSRNLMKSGRRMGDITQNVPLSVLIIQARANYNSNYNRLTHHRWALRASPFAGKTRAAGRAAMKAAENRLINSRHSSTKFLLAGWIPVIKEMARHAIKKYTRGAPPALEGKDSYYGADLGGATPATEAAEVAAAVIENNIGGQGVNAKNYNDALMTHGLPALQSAIDREGTQQMNYALKKMEQELAGQVTKAWR